MYDALTDTVSRLRLRLLTAGCARVHAPWQGTVNAPPFSRLYFILDGAFRIIGADGQETKLAAPRLWLVPAGYSFRFHCADTMEHVYFHLRLTAVDELDLLSAVPYPLSATRNSASDPRSLLGNGAITESMACLSGVYSALHTILTENHITLHSRQYSPPIRRALEVIHARPSLRLSVAEIAGEAHLAPSTLARNFRRETGMSVGAYLDSLIMQQAEQLVVGTDLPLSAISDQFGFCDQFYFSRRFREKFGMPPSRLRAQPRV